MTTWIWDKPDSLAAMAFGALIVGVFFWSRFDEPSQDGTSEYLTRYKPRFLTSRRRYALAKFGYVCAALMFLFVFTSMPASLFNELLPGALREKAKNGDPALPLSVALAMIALPTIPWLNEGERRIRGLLHSVARIPESIRRTVAQMRGAPFNCSSAAMASQTRKLNMQTDKAAQEPTNLNKLIFDDDLLNIWYTSGCVLCALSESNQANTGINPLFYDYYKEELDSIGDKHVALAPAVRRYLTDLLRANCPSDVPLDQEVIREARKLRDRLYTFIACGVRFSAMNDAESLDVVSRLGFAVRPERSEKPHITALAGLSVIALFILSVFVVETTVIFTEHVLEKDQIERLKIPNTLTQQFLWSWSTAAYYFLAILGALIIRSVHIGRRDWFDINNLERERPFLNYAKPILLGGALGVIALLVIALFGGPLFRQSDSRIGDALSSAGKQALPWSPLGFIIAAIALWLSDNPIRNASCRMFFVRATCAALIMMAVGFASSGIVYGNMGKEGLYMGLFIAGQIGLITIVLCIVLQMCESYTDRARSFAGKCIYASTRKGRIFYMRLNRDGTACLLPPDGVNLKDSAAVCRGHWQQFPEGTAVKWDREDDCCGNAGGFGLISAFGDSLIYEAYTERFSGTPTFFAQLNVRTQTETRASQSSPADKSPDTEPSALQASLASATDATIH